MTVDSRHWPLRGAWRVWFWFSALLGALFVVVGVAILGFVAIAWRWIGPGSLLLLLPGLGTLGVGALISWQILHTATGVTLGADGTLVLHRLRAPLTTRAARVHRVRESALRSSYTPTVLETADGWVYLVRTQHEKDQIVNAVRAHNPHLAI